MSELDPLQEAAEAERLAAWLRGPGAIAAAPR